MKTAVEVKGLTKRFGQFTAVDKVDMVIPREAVYGFLGHNGSGKTTAIRMMCGLLEPSAGEIEVLGMKIPEQTRQIRREVGYMTQKFSLYSDLTILQNMQFMALIMGVERSKRKGRVHDLLEDLISAVLSTDLQEPSPEARSGGWHWLRPLSTTLNCCFWMNRHQKWTRIRVENFGTNFLLCVRGNNGPGHHSLNGRSRAVPPVSHPARGTKSSRWNAGNLESEFGEQNILSGRTRHRVGLPCA